MSLEDKSLLTLIQEFEFLRAAERHFTPLGYKGVVSELIQKSEQILDEIKIRENRGEADGAANDA